MSDRAVYSIVNATSAKVIVTRPNLVPHRGQSYDARIADPPRLAGRESRYAGKLGLEAQEQA